MAQQQWDEAHPGISPEALAALAQQNQQAYSTMLDVQNSLDAYASQTGATPGSSTGAGSGTSTSTGTGSSASTGTGYGPSTNTGGSGGSTPPTVGIQVVVYGPDGRSYPSPEAAMAAGVTNYSLVPPGTEAISAQSDPLGSVSALSYSTPARAATPTQSTPSGVTPYIPTGLADRSSGGPSPIDFTQFSFPTQSPTAAEQLAQPAETPAATPSVQDIYPLFDTGTNP